jgi:hypothetical protein
MLHDWYFCEEEATMAMLPMGSWDNRNNCRSWYLYSDFLASIILL